MKSSPRIILELLQRHESQWMTGLELIRFSGEELKRGVIYVHLGSLEEADCVLSRPKAGDEFGRFEFEPPTNVKTASRASAEPRNRAPQRGRGRDARCSAMTCKLYPEDTTWRHAFTQSANLLERHPQG